jgi:SIR2-like domain
MNLEEIGQTLRDFIAQPRSVLFAGAGVGCRVDLPGWADWLDTLASVCTEFDDDPSATLIRARVQQGDYLGAATVYKTCRNIPVGERLARMAAPFRTIPGDLKRLETLISLPITGIVTTNYDRSLHEACAQFRGHAVMPLELRDQTLRNAALISEFFVARIHGRAELPECMVVDYYDYERLQHDNDYLDFLVTLLRLRPTAFIGFSFVDPAIEEILAAYKKNFGPRYPAMHIAIVPSGPGNKLAAELAAVNIRLLEYDPTNGHTDLWRAIRIAHERLPSPAPDVTVSILLPKDLPQSRLHRVIAFAYARTKAPTTAIRPALEMVQDGVLLAILNDEPASHLEKTSAVERMRELMRVDEITANVLFNQSFQRLVAAGEVIDTGRYIRRSTGPKGELEARLNELAGAVLNRLKVLYGRDPEAGE